MARKTKKDIGAELWNQNEFLKGVLSHIPEDKQPEIFEYLGEHALLRSEASRMMDTAKQEAETAAAHRANLDNWYAQSQQAIAYGLTAKEKLEAAETELGRLRAAVAGGTTPEPTPAPAIDASKFLSREEAEKLGQQIAQQAAAQSWQNTTGLTKVAIRHMREFGEDLDIEKLANHASQRRISLDDAWREIHKEKLDAKAEENKEKEKADLRRQIEDEVRQKMSGNSSPYPVPGSDMPTTLSGLGKQPTEAEFGVAAAIKEYHNQLNAKRN